MKLKQLKRERRSEAELLRLAGIKSDAGEVEASLRLLELARSRRRSDQRRELQTAHRIARRLERREQKRARLREQHEARKRREQEMSARRRLEMFEI